jgi:hypothetical protein
MPEQMRVAIGLPSKTDDWHFILAKQMGCEEVVLATPADLPREERWEYEDLARLRERVESFGLKIGAIQNTPAEFINEARLGLPAATGRSKTTRPPSGRSAEPVSRSWPTTSGRTPDCWSCAARSKMGCVAQTTGGPGGELAMHSKHAALVLTPVTADVLPTDAEALTEHLCWAIRAAGEPIRAGSRFVLMPFMLMTVLLHLLFFGQPVEGVSVSTDMSA